MRAWWHPRNLPRHPHLVLTPPWCGGAVLPRANPILLQVAPHCRCQCFPAPSRWQFLSMTTGPRRGWSDAVLCVTSLDVLAIPDCSPPSSIAVNGGILACILTACRLAVDMLDLRHGDGLPRSHRAWERCEQVRDQIRRFARRLERFVQVWTRFSAQLSGIGGVGKLHVPCVASVQVLRVLIFQSHIQKCELSEHWDQNSA